MRYKIAWRHTGTTRVIIGQITFPSLEAAADVARAMDIAWPETSHWPVRMDRAFVRHALDLAAEQGEEALAYS